MEVSSAHISLVPGVSAVVSPRSPMYDRYLYTLPPSFDLSSLPALIFPPSFDLPVRLPVGCSAEGDVCVLSELSSQSLLLKFKKEAGRTTLKLMAVAEKGWCRLPQNFHFQPPTILRDAKQMDG